MKTNKPSDISTISVNRHEKMGNCGNQHQQKVVVKGAFFFAIKTLYHFKQIFFKCEFYTLLNHQITQVYRHKDYIYIIRLQK